VTRRAASENLSMAITDPRIASAAECESSGAASYS